jgi:hypothetical protein
VEGDAVNFIDTVTIRSKMRVFRFEYHADNSKYFISPIDHQKLPAFAMQQVDGQWKIMDTVSDDIREAEKLFHDIIRENTAG